MTESDDAKVKDLISILQLRPLPNEGGFYRETHRSPVVIPKSYLPDTYDGPRAATTAILYLITPDSFSRLPRVRTDEVFHFYMGHPVEMIQLDQDGELKKYILGHDILNKQHVQLTVPANTWQGTRLLGKGRFALLGTTVAPGFEFADYEHADPGRLKTRFPKHAREIERFT